MMHKDSDVLNALLEDIEKLHPKKIDLGLDRIERVLKKLGNPHQKLPPTIHIAGTNGKGSTVAFLRAMAQAQGLKVHVYTSPHLVSFTERIVLAGDPVSEPILIETLNRVLDANNGEQLSFFEATTAAAFLAFSEHPADLLLLEVGLGGLFDATNVIDRPAAVGIAPIDYDHAEFLGRDLAQIAREKAGIMKRHTPAFSAVQSDLVRAVLESEAQKTHCDLAFANEGFRAYAQQGRLVFEDDDELLDLPLPALRGAHQIQNAGLAIALAKSLLLDRKAIAKGLEQARWPARLQSLTEGKLACMAQKIGAELWLDGGHNPHAGMALASGLAELDAKSPRPLILICGMLGNKDVAGFLDAFDGLAQTLVAVPIPGHAGLMPETLADIAKGRGMNSFTDDNVEDGMKRACGFKSKTPPRILICGSLYLAGQVLSLD
jgi:dihydrofolate synthase/folylpolyglutamate synthase